MASTAADTGRLEGVAAAAAAQGYLGSYSQMRSQHMHRRERSNTQPSCYYTRTYNEILGRRPIHSPRSNKTPEKPSPTTPKTPKSCNRSKQQLKNRLKFEKTPLQSAAKRKKVEPETSSPRSANRRKPALSLTEGPITRRRSLYSRRSPGSPVKAEADQQSIGKRPDHNDNKTESLPKRRCYDLDLPKAEAPIKKEACRRLSPETEVKLIDISLAASRDENDFCQPSCSSATAKPKKEESRSEESKVEPVPLDNGAAESNLSDMPAPAEALDLSPDPAAAPDVKVDTKESILKTDEEVLEVDLNSLESVHREWEIEADSLQTTQVDLPEATTELHELQLHNRSSEDTIAKTSPRKGCILM